MCSYECNYICCFPVTMINRTYYCHQSSNINQRISRKSKQKKSPTTTKKASKHFSAFLITLLIRNVCSNTGFMMQFYVYSIGLDIAAPGSPKIDLNLRSSKLLCCFPGPVDSVIVWSTLFREGCFSHVVFPSESYTQSGKWAGGSLSCSSKPFLLFPPLPL